MPKIRANPYPNMASFFGWNMQGNLGPWTCYQNAHRRPVWYLTMPQIEAPSPARIHVKDQFKAAMLAWDLLSAATRLAWMTAAIRANLRVHGLNLWVFWFLRADDQAIRTIERQTGITLLGLA